MIGVSTAIVQDLRIRKIDNTFAIKLRLTYQRKQKYFPLGISFNQLDWERIQSPKPRGTFKEHQIYFNKIEQKAVEIIRELKVFNFKLFEEKFNESPSDKTDIL
ncbi:MAG: integrase/recombinase XerD, partial [Arcticibacterium sp.]